MSYINAEKLVNCKSKKYDEDLIEFETMNTLFSQSLFPENTNYDSSKEIDREAMIKYKRELSKIR